MKIHLYGDAGNVSEKSEGLKMIMPTTINDYAV